MSEAAKKIVRLTWLTEDEIAFIKDLGKYRWIGRKQQLINETKDRLTALRNYLAAAQRRHNWGEVDRAKVIGVAMLEIGNEEARRGKGR